MNVKSSDNGPHSMVFWLKVETQERKPNGQLAGIPKESKDYHGVIHCSNRGEVTEIRERFVKFLTEELKKCQILVENNKQILLVPLGTENQLEV